MEHIHAALQFLRSQPQLSHIYNAVQRPTLTTTVAAGLVGIGLLSLVSRHRNTIPANGDLVVITGGIVSVVAHVHLTMSVTTMCPRTAECTVFHVAENEIQSSLTRGSLASTGIGKAVALYLASVGFHVFATGTEESFCILVTLSLITLSDFFLTSRSETRA